MPSSSIRIDREALALLRELARQQKQPLQTVLKQAIERFRREKFLEEANAAFGALRNDPDAWSDERQERELWDRASGDGLDRE